MDDRRRLVTDFDGEGGYIDGVYASLVRRDGTDFFVAGDRTYRVVFDVIPSSEMTVMDVTEPEADAVGAVI